MMIQIALLLAVVFMAYSNGSNDNFKGVATLYGSGTAVYRKSLIWGTITTLAGALLSLILAGELVKNFSGKGLVPDSIAASPVFLLAVALGTGITVILATRTGFPVSTTHALTGSLLGAGIASIGTQVNFEKLGKVFFLPLAFSPIAALALAAICYAVFRALRQTLGIGKETCLCVAPSPSIVAAGNGTLLNLLIPAPPSLIIDTQAACLQQYKGNVLGIRAQGLLDTAHFLSAGLVSFARGLNDTPKIVALLLGSSLLGLHLNLLLVALAMAIGGLLNAHKVALTMSHKITTMNHGQGFTANLVTAGLVLLASRFGLPVSTTHVSVGAISGIGLLTGQGNPKVLLQIILSWVLTLPIGALTAYIAYLAVVKV